MTVKEYREKHPRCEYCLHNYARFPSTLFRCPATEQRMSKRTAKKCPCYIPKSCDTDCVAAENNQKLLSLNKTLSQRK